MSSHCHIDWTIRALGEPRPWLTCPNCDAPRPFRCSGRIRLNANGRRLDAWLIYRCAVCDATWNRPSIERRHVRDIPAEMLRACESSDLDFVHRIAFDLDGLRRHSSRIEESPDLAIETAILAGSPHRADRIDITLRLATPVALRLDRLLAASLRLGRSTLTGLVADGSLDIDGGPALLKRRLRDGMTFGLVLSGLPDPETVRAACMAPHRPQ